MEPVVLALEKKYDDDVQFISADVTNGANPKTQSDEQAAQLAQIYNVSSIPAIFLIDKNGNVVAQEIGPQSFDYLSKKIDNLIEKSK